MPPSQDIDAKLDKIIDSMIALREDIHAVKLEVQSTAGKMDAHNQRIETLERDCAAIKAQFDDLNLKFATSQAAAKAGRLTVGGATVAGGGVLGYLINLISQGL